MLLVQLTPQGADDIRRLLRSLMSRSIVFDEDLLLPSAIEELLKTVPDQPALWRVPEWGEPFVRRHLKGLPDVYRAIKVAGLRERDEARAYLQREMVARQLFDASHGVTNPDLRSVLWGNLNAEDRKFWMDRADELLVG